VGFARGADPGRHSGGGGQQPGRVARWDLSPDLVTDRVETARFFRAGALSTQAACDSSVGHVHLPGLSMPDLDNLQSITLECDSAMGCDMFIRRSSTTISLSPRSGFR
jgi:hypothetical protein